MRIVKALQSLAIAACPKENRRNGDVYKYGLRRNSVRDGDEH